MSTVGIKIGPADQGRRMSLAEFEHAEAEEGWLYELSRGVVTVSDVPKPKHFLLVDAIRDQSWHFRRGRPRLIFVIASGMECKLLIRALESERHPDLAVYMTPPPGGRNDDDVWSVWIPTIVIEVVSPSSRRWDYEEKPEEYLRLGIGECWIVDADEELIKVLKRSRGNWREVIVRPPALYKTRHLPGLEFSIARVFEAVKGS